MEVLLTKLKFAFASVQSKEGIISAAAPLEGVRVIMSRWRCHN